MTADWQWQAADWRWQAADWRWRSCWGLLSHKRVESGNGGGIIVMVRACAALVVWAILAVVLGIPVLLLGLVPRWTSGSRWLFARCSRLWGKAMLAIAGVRLTIAGKEHLAGSEPRFYMANHQSALDIPIVLVAVGGNLRFFSKSSLFRIPVFGWILSRYGFIPIHKSKPRLTHRGLERMLIRLKRNPISLTVFPEGTRTRDGSLSPFRKGTMRIATRAGLTVVPVAIDGSLAVNHRDEWRLRPGPVRVTLTEPIPGSEVSRMSPTDLHDRVVGAITAVLDQSLYTPAGVY